MKRVAKRKHRLKTPMRRQYPRLGTYWVALHLTLETAATTGHSGWFATGYHDDANEDHCVSLCGYGNLLWLAQQLKVKVPNAIEGSNRDTPCSHGTRSGLLISHR
jgi:hypothetical protein